MPRRPRSATLTHALEDAGKALDDLPPPGGSCDLPLAVANFADARKLDGIIAAGRYEVVARPVPAVALLRRR